MATDRLTLCLVTQERQLLEQPADAVVLPGGEGYLEILPGHAALVSTLRPGVLRCKSGGQETSFATGPGFCEVLGNRVTVLVDSAERPEEIDRGAAEAARAEAERALASASADELDRWHSALAHAQARLDVAARRPGAG